MNMCPYMDEKWDSYLQVFFIIEIERNPLIMDHDLKDDEKCLVAIRDLSPDPSIYVFDEFKDYRSRIISWKY
jgi:hypothetical protein